MPGFCCGYESVFFALDAEGCFLLCPAGMRLSPLEAHRLHRFAFADLHPRLPEFLPDLFMFALRRKLRFSGEILRPESHEIAMPRFLRLKLRKSQLLPNLARTNHVLFFRQREGREVRFASRIDQE